MDLLSDLRRMTHGQPRESDCTMKQYMAEHHAIEAAALLPPEEEKALQDAGYRWSRELYEIEGMWTLYQGDADTGVSLSEPGGLQVTWKWSTWLRDGGRPVWHLAESAQDAKRQAFAQMLKDQS